MSSEKEKIEQFRGSFRAERSNDIIDGLKDLLEEKTNRYLVLFNTHSPMKVGLRPMCKICCLGGRPATHIYMP